MREIRDATGDRFSRLIFGYTVGPKPPRSLGMERFVVSSLALMRWLEASPERYDAGMRALTFGRVTRLHAAVAEAAAPKPGKRVLEIGCGTGAVTVRLLEREAHVTALDQSPEMLEQARARLGDSPRDGLEWIERTASEIDGMRPADFDAVVLSLCLSEMSRGERAFVLREAAARLRPGGCVVVADEVRALRGGPRALQRLWRFPQAALGWLLVGAVSRPVPDLRGELRDAGLRVIVERRWLLGTLAMMVAEPEP